MRDKTILAVGLGALGALGAAVLAALLVSAAVAAGEPLGGGKADGATAEVAAVPSHASARRAPELLSQTGLYLADGSIDPRNRPFAPQYPLWTDGAAKARWVRLPEGSKIDVSDVDAWKFPAGTTFWKEFSWGGRKVETRMVRIGAKGQLTFASYVWKDDQTDAVLAPATGVPGVYEIAAGKRHSIPSVADCISCHTSAPSVALGFTALQLSDDRDPLAPHAVPVPDGGVTLRTLVAEGLLSPLRSELVTKPPRIRASDPTARAAMGYLSANCGHCHNTRGPLARLGFSFLHDSGAAADAPEPVLVTAVASHGRFMVPGIAADSSYVIAPGAPDRSVVVYRMSSRRPSSQMPPVGTTIPDDQALKLVRQWIESLRAPSGTTAMVESK